ncbi:MAG: hypothetical protein ACI9EF_001805 [Pseudohongiellaceae bacterium]|jgi:hypothetical protein
MTYYGATATMMLLPQDNQVMAYGNLEESERGQIQQLWLRSVDQRIEDLDEALSQLENLGYSWDGQREDVMALLNVPVEKTFSPLGDGDPVSSVWLSTVSNGGWIDCGRNCHYGTKYLVITRAPGEVHDLVTVTADVVFGDVSTWNGIVAVKYVITTY